MITFAITGGIATGKSTVTSIIRNQYNIPIVDADIIARQVVEVGTPCLSKLVASFSDKILNNDGSLNRKCLGDICFSDKSALNTINSIMGKQIKKESIKQIKDFQKLNNYLVGYDSALVIESKAYMSYKPIIVVTCSPETQLSRLMKRNNFTQEEAQKRIDSQMSLEEKVKYADYVINNDNGLIELNREIDSVVAKLKQL